MNDEDEWQQAMYKAQQHDPEIVDSQEARDQYSMDWEEAESEARGEVMAEDPQFEAIQHMYEQIQPHWNPMTYKYENVPYAAQQRAMAKVARGPHGRLTVTSLVEQSAVAPGVMTASIWARQRPRSTGLPNVRTCRMMKLRSS